MVITDVHKKQAADLLESLKAANPDHPFFIHVEAAADSLKDHVVEGVTDAAMIPLFAVLCLVSTMSGRPLFCG